MNCPKTYKFYRPYNEDMDVLVYKVYPITVGNRGYIIVFPKTYNSGFIIDEETEIVTSIKLEYRPKHISLSHNRSMQLSCNLMMSESFTIVGEFADVVHLSKRDIEDMRNLKDLIFELLKSSSDIVYINKNMQYDIVVLLDSKLIRHRESYTTLIQAHYEDGTIYINNDMFVDTPVYIDQKTPRKVISNKGVAIDMYPYENGKILKIKTGVIIGMKINFKKG